MTWRHALVMFSNVGIVVGYFLIAFLLLPRVTEFVRRLVPFVSINLHWTTAGGAVFFVTCGITHAELVLHLAFEPQESATEMATSWHAVLNHAIQVVAVWTLIVGTYLEFARPVTRALIQKEGWRG